MGALARKGLDGYLMGEEKEPYVKMSSEWKEWRATHTSLYTWLLNSMVPLIATIVDEIQNVKDILEKFKLSRRQVLFGREIGRFRSIP